LRKNPPIKKSRDGKKPSRNRKKKTYLSTPHFFTEREKSKYEEEEKLWVSKINPAKTKKASLSKSLNQSNISPYHTSAHHQDT